jgi:hypothetical protein
MLAHLSSATAGSVISVLAVLCLAVASVLRKWIEESFRTRRFIKSIEEAPPQARSEIIRACGQLETRPPSPRPGRHAFTILRLSPEYFRASGKDNADQWHPADHRDADND